VQLIQVRNLAWAAVRAGVEWFVASSAGDSDRDRGVSAGEPWEVERLLMRFDLPLTLLRPAFFMDGLDRYALRRDPGGRLVLRTPLSEKSVVPWIALEDVGTLVRLAFDRPEAFGPGPVPLAADEQSLAEVRATLSEALGETVRYEQIAVGEVKDRRARGLYRWFQTSARDEPDVQKLRRLHPGLQTLQQWLERSDRRVSTPAA
jgi:uncharacterized protein YbjT (DUF2867 family)